MNIASSFIYYIGIALCVGLQVFIFPSCLRNDTNTYSSPCSHASDRIGYFVRTLAIRRRYGQFINLCSSSPGVVVANTHSIGASLTVWLSAGLLAWTGASSFAELGSSIPVNGGAQAYLQYSYGPLASYLFAWTAISALKPGTQPDCRLECFRSVYNRRQCRYKSCFRGISQSSNVAYDERILAR